MNETIKTIVNRRSIRKYKEEQIKDEELQLIIKAGKYAPSAVDQQSWHFTVVQNTNLLNKINEACKKAYVASGNKIFAERSKIPGFSIFYKAPTLIIVSCDQKAVAPTNDGSLALGNMFLAAESLGIGTCWINALNFLFTTEEGKILKSELDIPENYITVGSGAFGYKDMEQPQPSPRKEGTVTMLK